VRALIVVVIAVAACGHKDSSSTAGSASAAPAAPAADAMPTLPESCKAICAKNISCAGVTGAEAITKAGDCEQVCNGQANGDPLAAEVVPMAMASVAAKCSKVPCAQFGDCYMDALKAEQEALTGVPAEPTTPIPAELRAHFVQLTCQVVAESPGKIPDLNDPHPSLALQELKDLANQITEQQHSAGAIADMMKEALATCGH
jgi:hypothetical protein